MAFKLDVKVGGVGMVTPPVASVPPDVPSDPVARDAPAVATPVPPSDPLPE